MLALTSATVRRLVVISRELGDPELPTLELRAVDDHAIHYARALGIDRDAGLATLELALRLRDRRGSHRYIVAVGADVVDRLVPIGFVLDDLAARELAAWPAPQDVVELAAPGGRGPNAVLAE